MAATWLVSCNVQAFDIVKYLENNNTFVIKRTRPLSEGDLVYLYVGSPYKRIMFVCKVVDDSMSPDKLSNSYAKVGKCPNVAKRYMELSVEKTFSTIDLTYQNLRDHGVGQLQNPSRISAKTERYIQSVIERGENDL
jgi:hypothetical protein